MQVMWNAVFYDSIAEYSSTWRRNKLWFGQPNVKEAENVLAKTVSKAYIQFFMHTYMSLNLIL